MSSKKKPRVVTQNVGADLSKDDFKVNFQQKFVNQNTRVKGSRAFKNTLSDFKEFVKWVEKNRDSSVMVRITMEATGVYYEQLVHYLKDKTDYHISVVLPNKTNAYFKSLNIKSKTDKIDAKVLAQMGLERNLKQWEPISNNIRVLKQLTRDRVSLIDLKTAISNRVHALEHSYQPHKQVLKRLKQQLVLIKKQIKEVELQIQEAVNKDAYLKERIDKIQKVKGLGLITIATIIAETGGFVLFTSRGQLVSYAGYDVVENQSGSSIKGKTRISKKGNKFIRRALYFPAISIIKYDDNFKQSHERIFDRTKIKMKGYVAIQRRILILIYTLFKKNEEYNSNFKKQEVKKDDSSNRNQTKENCRQDTILPTLDSHSKVTSLVEQI